ncbi:hypothetical protein KKD52_01685 [Myxococcota bacterium]|nr:hypothetical protein [Myxococcota bacterium]
MSLLLMLSLLLANPENVPVAPPGFEEYTNPTVSVHAMELENHAGTPVPLRTYNYVPGTPRALTRVVYGYLPYWISDTSQIRWQDLSHLGYFSLEMNTAGNITNAHGWPDLALVQTAHAAGVDVEVVFTLFGDTDIDSLLNNATARATAITNMVNAMESGGADGINIDFEFVPSSARTAFVMFLQGLRNELNNRGHINATISFAGPTSVSDGLDFPAIFQVLDYYFIMAYGYHWSGSTYAGPTGKLRVTSAWSPAGTLSLLRTLANIGAAVGEDMRHKIVAGLPLYGREWTTAAGTWPSTANTHIGSVTYAAARALIAGGKTRSWDAGICNPAIIWQEGGVWHQVWYEDEQSLACKFDLVKQQNIGGMGYWALGYDNGYSEVWDTLEAHFAAPAPLGAGSRDNPIPITAFPYSDARNTATGGYSYFNYYSCRTDLAEYGKEFVYQIDVCQPGSLTATVPDDPNIDPDVHLLTGLREDTCIARAHLTFTQAITPGRYYLTVDTYVDNSVELDGAYTLDVNYVPSGGTPCPTGTTCSAGTCVCEDGLAWCANTCVDTESSAQHCGGCDIPCGAPNTCVNGDCLGDNPDAGPDGDTDGDTDAQADAGPDAQPDTDVPCDTCTTTTKCACRSAGSGSAPFPAGLFLIALLLGLALRRSR